MVTHTSLTGGQISGTGTVLMNGYLFGGIVINGDGTNDCTVVVRETNASGDILLHVVSKVAADIILPIKSNAQLLYYSISGTGGTAQLFEAIV